LTPLLKWWKVGTLTSLFKGWKIGRLTQLMKVRVGEEADSSGDRAKVGKADSPGERAGS
jgi:hypothetical protein